MKRNLTVGLLIALLLLSLTMVTGAAGVEKKQQVIGYVNMEKLFINHPAKASSEVELNQEAQRLQKKLETEAKNMTKEERQQLLQRYQEELNGLEKELVEKVMDDINKKIRKVAKEKEISVVVDKQAVFYGGYDLTEDVLEVIKAEGAKEVEETEEENKESKEE